MSLINDVLRDLDRRQAGTAPTVPGTDSTKALPVDRKTAWWPWLAGAVFLGALAQVAYMAWPLPAAKHAPSAPQVASVETEPVILASAAAAEPQTPAQPEATSPDESPQPRAVQSPPTTTAHAAPPAAEAPPTSNQPEKPQPDTEKAVAAVEPQPRPQPAPLSQSREPAPSGSDPAARIEIQRSASRETEDSVDQALRAAARGQLGLAESQLTNHLLEAPDDTRARLLLAEVLVSQQRPLNARSALAAGLNRNSSKELAPALARLLQATDPAAARDVLLRYPPAIADAPDYHLLLAALHRQLGEHEQAAELYRRLTEIDPANTTAWVGLGSSLESLGQPADAREAYEIAAQSGEPRLSAFARQRLSALPATGEQP
jgi:MSHA biogenesis protein MshN